MSILDDIIGIGRQAVDFLGSNSVASNLVKTALIGYASRKVNDSINRENQKPAATRTPEIDPGVRLQIQPDTAAKIPLVYGTAQLSGIISDAELTADRLDMYVCFTICELTGVKLSDSVQSAFTFGRLYVNDQRVVFDSNGYTVLYTVDREGNVDRSLAGLVDIRLWAGGSAASYNVAPAGYSLASTVDADTVMPSWVSTDDMSELIFAICRFRYDRDKGLTRIPTVRFQVTNTMTKPGDVVYDYMTNTRYGAGIPAGDIFSA